MTRKRNAACRILQIKNDILWTCSNICKQLLLPTLLGHCRLQATKGQWHFRHTRTLVTKKKPKMMKNKSWNRSYISIANEKPRSTQKALKVPYLTIFAIHASETRHTYIHSHTHVTCGFSSRFFFFFD